MKIGTWRLSNHRFTINVEIDADDYVIATTPGDEHFIGRRFEDVCRRMQTMGKTDIILLRIKN